MLVQVDKVVACGCLVRFVEVWEVIQREGISVDFGGKNLVKGLLREHECRGAKTKGVGLGK